MKYFAYILLFAAILLLCISIGRSVYAERRTVVEEFTLFELPITAIPVATVNPVEETVSVGAGSYIVLDAASSVVLAQKNADELFFPASTAKMMTALVATELYDPSTVITIPFQALGLGESVLFGAGTNFTVNDLIKAALIQSHNAAALALAQADPVGTAHFIQEMNKKAEELHLNQTRFDNPVGFDSEYMQSSARDLAFLAKALIAKPNLREVVATPQALITDAITGKSYTLHNTNALLGYNNQVFGIKTGTTDLAGQVLVTLAVVDGHEVIIVVLDSYDRYTDTKALLHWVNTEVEWYKPEELAHLPGEVSFNIL